MSVAKLGDVSALLQLLDKFGRWPGENITAHDVVARVRECQDTSGTPRDFDLRAPPIEHSSVPICTDDAQDKCLWVPETLAGDFRKFWPVPVMVARGRV